MSAGCHGSRASCGDLLFWGVDLEICSGTRAFLDIRDMDLKYRSCYYLWIWRHHSLDPLEV